MPKINIDDYEDQFVEPVIGVPMRTQRKKKNKKEKRLRGDGDK